MASRKWRRVEWKWIALSACGGGLLGAHLAVLAGVVLSVLYEGKTRAGDLELTAAFSLVFFSPWSAAGCAALGGIVGLLRQRDSSPPAP